MGQNDFQVAAEAHEAYKNSGALREMVDDFQIVGVPNTERIGTWEPLLAIRTLAHAIEDPILAADVVTGYKDREIAAGLYYKTYDQLPRTVADLYHVEDLVKVFKKQCYQRLLDGVAQNFDQLRAGKTRETVKNNDTPHPVGTTTQLAEMTGLSKKQIRRMKQEGVLDKYLIEHGFMTEEAS